MRGTKGFVFSLDAFVAVLVFAVVLLISGYYVTVLNQDRVPDLQMIKTGQDILAVLDYKGTLDTLDINQIENEVNNILPVNYHMRILITGNFPASPLIMETTNENPTDSFVGTGKRVFYNGQSSAVAQFWVWLK